LNLKLHIYGVSKSYHHGSVRALDGIEFELTPGVYGLLGPNGAGKSTLLNILTGNLRPDTGMVTYNGEDIEKLGDRYRDRLGYMPQQQQLYDDFTGTRFLWYVAAMKGLSRKRAKESISRLLDIVNLREAAHKKLSAYSGGMKQRILIAQALLNDPDVLILDEPTAGLDPKERINIRNFIAAVAMNKIVLLATHVVSDIEFIAKEVILLKQGKIVMRGEPAELLKTMEGRVYEVKITGYEDVEKLRQTYRISNISNDSRGIWVRLVSDAPPAGYLYESARPNLEDLYLDQFG